MKRKKNSDGSAIANARQLSLHLIAAALVVSGSIYSSHGQSWTPTIAPTNNWTSISSSANGSELVAAANNAFEGVQKAVKQATDAAEANFQTISANAAATITAGAPDRRRFGEGI